MPRTLPIRLTIAAVLLIAVGIMFVLQDRPTNGDPAPMEAARVVERPGIARPDKLRDPGGIENCFQVAPNLWIGSQPEGSHGFQLMTQMSGRSGRNFKNTGHSGEVVMHGQCSRLDRKPGALVLPRA